MNLADNDNGDGRRFPAADPTRLHLLTTWNIPGGWLLGTLGPRGMQVHAMCPHPVCAGLAGQGAAPSPAPRPTLRIVD